LRFIWNY